MSRRCRSCSECCTALAVIELGKDEFSRCGSVKPGCGGCAIYEARPESCREWFCGWLQGYGANADRPDRIGVVLDAEEGVHGEGIIKAWITKDTPRGRQRIQELARNQVVYVMLPGRRKLLGPPASVQRFINAAASVGLTEADIYDPVKANAFVQGADHG